jgi:hypothetical protein
MIESCAFVGGVGLPVVVVENIDVADRGESVAVTNVTTRARQDSLELLRCGQLYQRIVLIIDMSRKAAARSFLVRADGCWLSVCGSAFSEKVLLPHLPIS